MTASTKSAHRPSPGDGTDLLQLDRQVCFALAVASRNVIALYRPLLEPMGLTHPQYLVMLALWEDSPLRVSELATRLSLEPATLSPLLKRLEASGMVTRGRDPLDDRALAVSLTRKGAAARKRAERIPPAIIDRLGMELSASSKPCATASPASSRRPHPPHPDHAAYSGLGAGPHERLRGRRCHRRRRHRCPA